VGLEGVVGSYFAKATKDRGEMIMKKRLQKRYRYHALLLFLVIANIPSFSFAYSVVISFDSYLPKTWYQKGLEASLSVWQMLINGVEKGRELKLDLVMGKLAFAQFCIERMLESGQQCLEEDIVYLRNVVERIGEVMGEFGKGGKEEFFECCDDIIFKIIKVLN
jgi:hypothetical protein